jgi:hypothetical protein
MTNCDAWLKSVWHGVFMTREKRTKFADRWRQLSDPSLSRTLAYEYESAGRRIVCAVRLTHITIDIDCSGLQELKDDIDYADAQASFQHEPKSDEQIHDDGQFLSSYADDLSMILTIYLEQVSQWKNCFMFAGDFTIQSQIKAVEEKYDIYTINRFYWLCFM